jgi:hypothetical protein
MLAVASPPTKATIALKICIPCPPSIVVNLIIRSFGMNGRDGLFVEDVYGTATRKMIKNGKNWPKYATHYGYVLDKKV